MTVAMMDNKVGWLAGWLVHSNGLHYLHCLTGCYAGLIQVAGLVRQVIGLI